jgi:hypothetical protein
LDRYNIHASAFIAEKAESSEKEYGGTKKGVNPFDGVSTNGRVILYPHPPANFGGLI